MSSEITHDTKAEARRNLDSLLRRYQRKKASYERSEASYYERLHMWLWTFAMLEARSNPGTFAGDMPGHEEFIYSDYIEAADTAADSLASYIDSYVTPQTPVDEFYRLLNLEKQLKSDANTPYPGSGSRLDDARLAMESPEFQAVAQADQGKIQRMFKNSALQLGGDAKGIFLHLLDSLNH